MARPVVKLPTNDAVSRVQYVTGHVSSTTEKIEEFRGIPYGIVPGRWEHSVVRKSLPTDSYDASEHGPKCPQPSGPNNTEVFQSHLDFPDVGESEFDCLNLWILRPSSVALQEAGFDSSRSKLPVFFYIHGGGFAFGAGTDPMWNPTRMLTYSLTLGKPFIAVYINYRLNIIGFGASSSILQYQKKASQNGLNFGIVDQKNALRWVSQNIGAFGGDPDNVTICGQSAGAMSVDALVLDAQMNQVFPLFRRAIMQSGAFTTVTLGPHSLETCDSQWTSLCTHFAIANLSEEDKLKKIQEKSARDLIHATSELGWASWRYACDNSTIFQVSPNKWHVNLGNDGNGLESIHQKRALQVMIGDTDAEGSIFLAKTLLKIRNYEQIRKVFGNLYPSEADVDEVLCAYGIQPKSTKSNLIHSITNFVTDSMFGASVHLSYQSLPTTSHDISTGKYPTVTQLYRVRFGNPFLGWLREDPHHCVDILYLSGAFQNALAAQDENANDDWPTSNMDLSRQIQADWINFINGHSKPTARDCATVYNRDRSKSLLNITTEPFWVDLRQRFDVIMKNRLAAAAVTRRLVGGDFD